MNVEEDHIEEFIVPESIYYDSALGNALMNEDTASLQNWGLGLENG